MTNKDFFTLTSYESIKAANSSKTGLSEFEAAARLKTYGENQIITEKKANKIVLFFKQFSDLMVIILLLAATVSITIAIVNNSMHELVDGFIILAIVLINALIGFIQEVKALHSMEALKNLTEPEARVIRNGKNIKIHSKNLVLGDIILIEAGDIIPADCRLIESAGLKCDESSLTGESVPINKDAKKVCSRNTILSERVNMVYYGSVVTAGHGIAVVVATGKATEIGKIAKIITTSTKDETPLQKGIRQIGQLLTFVILFISVITFFIELLFSTSTPIEAFLTAIALAVAAIPESLPAVITVIMSLGVAKLARKKAIVKRLHAVETLGSCEVICSDKTGTLTQNKMTVKNVYYNQTLYTDVNYRAGETFKQLLHAMTLCNNSQKNNNIFTGDPTETALCNFALKAGCDKVILDNSCEKIGEIPFDSNRKLMSTMHINNGNSVVYTKGAIDEVLKLCNRILISGQIVTLSESNKQKILNANKKMAENALRILAFAYKPYNSGEQAEQNLIFIGLAGMIDPPRKEVKKAVSKCLHAGISPIMITGDHKDTALAIAKEIGIATSASQVLTGSELDLLSDSKFLSIINNVKVFARVSPENKVRIVEAFKSQGKIVAMTGDGVNDAPSIKRAHIGIGMGITGTDVTKEVADLIITDDNFATIIVAVEEGRKIYSNIKKTITFLFSANLAEIATIFIATLLYPSLTFLTPVQILFVNLISDTLPAIALGLEPPEQNIMDVKPRKSNSNIFSGGTWQSIVIMGIIQAVALLGCFFIGKYGFASEQIATTMAFYALNIIQFFYFASMRTADSVFKNNIFKNKWAVASIVTCFGIMALMALTPLGELLNLTTLTITHWLTIFAFCVIVLFASEIVKKYINKKYN